MVFCLRADGGIEAGDGFQVVIQYFRGLVEDFLQGGPVAAEIWNEDFNADAGGLEADLSDGLGPDASTAIFEFVAIYAGDDDVLQAHGFHGFTDSSGFIEIERRRAAGGDVAEAAASGADVAEDHEGGRSGMPAFAHVGAFGGLADGVEFLFVDQVQEPGIALA